MTLSCSSCSRTGRTRIGINRVNIAHEDLGARGQNHHKTSKILAKNAVRAVACHSVWLDRHLRGPPQWAVPPSATKTSRILIVDDDVSVTDTFSRMLRLEGYEVWAALSADEGLTLAQAHQPHAVILDLRMPLTSGLQFLRAIRAIPGLTSTPVAIVTGDYYLDEAQSAEIKALNAELRYKPLWLEELVTLARELLNAPVRDL